MKGVKLVISYLNGKTEERCLFDGTYVIGRELGDIVLQDAKVSSQHAVVQVFDGRATFIDQGSANGTFDIHGQRLQGPHILQLGQPLRLGTSSITLSSIVESGGTQAMPQVPSNGGTLAMPQVPMAAGGVAAVGVAGVGIAPQPFSPPTQRSRATVIKLPDTTPGLLVIGGHQKQFVLESIWRAAVAPVMGMNVEVELDSAGNVAAIFAVDAQQIVFEQGQQVADLARRGFGAAVLRMGKIELGAVVALWLGWFIFPAASFGFTFWDLLAFSPSSFGSLAGAGSHGLGSLLGLASIAAPLGVLFLKGRRTSLLNAAPFGFLILVAMRAGWGMLTLTSAAEDASNKLYGGMGAAMQSAQLRTSLWSHLLGTITWGFWIVVIASIVLFWRAGGPIGVIGGLRGAKSSSNDSTTTHVQQTAPVGLTGKGFSSVIERIGKVELSAVVVLWIGWFLLPSLTLGPMSLTFWDILGFDPSNPATLMAGTKNHGLGSLLGLASIAAPLGVLFLKGRRTSLLNAAPLGFLALLGALLGIGIYGLMSKAEETQSQLPSPGGSFGSGMASAMQSMRESSQNAMLNTLLGAISFGFWIVIIASIVLFVRAFRTRGALPNGFVVGVQGASHGFTGVTQAQPATELPYNSAPNAYPGAPVHGGQAAIARCDFRRVGMIGAGVGIVLLGGLGSFAFKHFSKTPAQRAGEMMAELTTILSNNTADCTMKAQEIKQLLESRGDDLKEFATLSGDQLKEFNSSFSSKDQTLKQLFDSAALMRCVGDPNFVSSMVALKDAFEPLITRSQAMGTSTEPQAPSNPQPQRPTTLPPIPQKPAPALSVVSPSSEPAAPVPPPTAAPVPVVPVPAATSNSPVAPPSPAAIGTTTYAVFDVPNGDSLSVRATPNPGAAKLLDFKPTETGIRSTGHSQEQNGTTWLEIAAPAGSGWVNRGYLVEEHVGACSDPRLTLTVDHFLDAVRRGNGSVLRSSTSPVHGLLLRTDIENPTVRIQPQMTQDLFTSTASQRWSTPNSAPVTGSFKDTVLPPFRRTLATTMKQSCGQVVLPSGDTHHVEWPLELRSLVPFTLSVTQPAVDSVTWVLGIEYVAGVPYVAALIEYAPPPLKPVALTVPKEKKSESTAAAPVKANDTKPAVATDPKKTDVKAKPAKSDVDPSKKEAKAKPKASKHK